MASSCPYGILHFFIFVPITSLTNSPIGIKMNHSQSNLTPLQLRMCNCRTHSDWGHRTFLIFCLLLHVDALVILVSHFLKLFLQVSIVILLITTKLNNASHPPLYPQILWWHEFQQVLLFSQNSEIKDFIESRHVNDHLRAVFALMTQTIFSCPTNPSAKLSTHV